MGRLPQTNRPLTRSKKLECIHKTFEYLFAAGYNFIIQRGVHGPETAISPSELPFRISRFFALLTFNFWEPILVLLQMLCPLMHFSPKLMPLSEP